MDINKYINELGEQAYAASREVASVSTEIKNTALNAIAKEIIKNKDDLIKINDQDLQTAKKSGLETALLDRLELTTARIDAMADGLKQVADLEDLIGKTTEYVEQASGIKVGRMRVPLGGIGIIYESRPNVTADA
ncbi:uncharacterized protein METZ01_LOCUS453779, partial [marine metagenome]